MGAPRRIRDLVEVVDVMLVQGVRAAFHYRDSSLLEIYVVYASYQVQPLRVYRKYNGEEQAGYGYKRGYQSESHQAIAADFAITSGPFNVPTFVAATVTLCISIALSICSSSPSWTAFEIASLIVSAV